MMVVMATLVAHSGLIRYSFLVGLGCGLDHGARRMSCPRAYIAIHCCGDACASGGGGEL
jgi:hypothetical protein